MIGFQSIALEGTATVPNFFRLVIAATWRPPQSARKQAESQSCRTGIGGRSRAAAGGPPVPMPWRRSDDLRSLTSGDLEKTLADIDSIGAELQR